MICVVGSLNLDIVVPVPRHPRPGETVLGGDHVRNPGGKGANQAVAAARLGSSVAMVGRVGDDDAGRELRVALRADGVDTEHVAVTSESPTGIALISVDERGENAIVVSPGANHRLVPEDVDAAGEVIGQAAVVLLQLEVPPETVERATRLAHGTVIMNPAPAAELPGSVLDRVDVLVPNRGELEHLIGDVPSGGVGGIAAAARRLPGPEAVVVTLGADGAVVVGRGEAHHVAAPRVEAVDTTAAGDCFCGALAGALERGEDLVAASRWAAAAAAIAVTRRGAQASLPTRAEVSMAEW